MLQHFAGGNCRNQVMLQFFHFVHEPRFHVGERCWVLSLSYFENHHCLSEVISSLYLFVCCRGFVFFDGLRHPGFWTFLASTLCLCFARVSVSWLIVIKYSTRNSVPLILFRNQLPPLKSFDHAPWLGFCQLIVHLQLHFSNHLSRLGLEDFLKFVLGMLPFCLFGWLVGADSWLHIYGNSLERKTRKVWANKWFEQTQARERYIKKKCFPDVVTMFVIIRVRGFESQGVVLLLLVLLVCCWLDVGMLGESYDDASHSREHSLIEII